MHSLLSGDHHQVPEEDHLKILGDHQALEDHQRTLGDLRARKDHLAQGDPESPGEGDLLGQREVLRSHQLVG